jgi:hypothetical protein
LTEAFSEFRNGGPEYQQWQNHVGGHIDELIQSQLSESERDDNLTEAYYNPPPVVHKRHIASGGLIVTSTEFSKQLESHNRNMAAVEMEAAGVLLAVKRTDGVNSVILRGISDFADEEKSSLDTMGGGLWRQCATYAAASCLAYFLKGGYLETIVTESPTAQPVESTADQTKDKQVSALEDDTSLAVEIDGNGPETNFLRQHQIGGDVVISSNTQENGLSMTAEFELSVSAATHLISIDITTEELARPEVIDQEIVVDGEYRATTDGTHTYLADPPVLSDGESVTIRLEKQHRLENPDGIDINGSKSLPITLSFEFENTAESAQFEYRGRIDRADGLVGISRVS